MGSVGELCHARDNNLPATGEEVDEQDAVNLPLSNAAPKPAKGSL